MGSVGQALSKTQQQSWTVASRMMKKGCRIITSDRSKNDLQGMSQMGNDPDAQDQSATGIGTWLGNHGIISHL